MTRILYARIVLAFIAIAVLGYGMNADRRDLRYAAMGILAVALLLRFVPAHWVEDTKEDK